MKSINKRKSVILSVLGAIKVHSPSYGRLDMVSWSYRVRLLGSQSPQLEIIQLC